MNKIKNIVSTFINFIVNVIFLNRRSRFGLKND